MNAKGAAEGSQWQARRAPPLVHVPVRSVGLAGATDSAGAPSAREHLFVPNQGSRGLTTAYPWLPSERHSVAVAPGGFAQLIAGLERRWFRSRRRRKVARAYDMALEISRVIPFGSQVLDVGCGNGFIAHHLTALLGTSAVGTDVEDITQVPISYRRYDRTQLPAEDNSFDAVLLCYVLHHAGDAGAMLKEMGRVLREGGFGVIYEDIPALWWDRFICWTHNLKWRNRTGPCTFRIESEWRSLFESSGFEVVSERQLARLRNLTHPVCRRFYLLRYSPNGLITTRPFVVTSPAQ